MVSNYIHLTKLLLYIWNWTVNLTSRNNQNKQTNNTLPWHNCAFCTIVSSQGHIIDYCADPTSQGMSLTTCLPSQQKDTGTDFRPIN